VRTALGAALALLAAPAGAVGAEAQAEAMAFDRCLAVIDDVAGRAEAFQVEVADPENLREASLPVEGGEVVIRCDRRASTITVIRNVRG